VLPTFSYLKNQQFESSILPHMSSSSLSILSSAAYECNGEYSSCAAGQGMGVNEEGGGAVRDGRRAA
jgi:hypothetical protein